MSSKFVSKQNEKSSMVVVIQIIILMIFLKRLDSIISLRKENYYIINIKSKPKKYNLANKTMTRIKIEQ
jgi:hypothetical protein